MAKLNILIRSTRILPKFPVPLMYYENKSVSESYMNYCVSLFHQYKTAEYTKYFLECKTVLQNHQTHSLICLFPYIVVSLLHLRFTGWQRLKRESYYIPNHQTQLFKNTDTLAEEFLSWASNYPSRQFYNCTTHHETLFHFLPISFLKNHKTEINSKV